MTNEPARERPHCDICGQSYFRHMEICGVGRVCPVSAVTYREPRLRDLKAPSPQPDTDVVERVAPPMYADCDTYVAGQYVFNYLRAFLAAAGIDASLCKLVIELPDRDVQRQLVGVLQKDAKGPSRSAARIGNYSGTWQGVEYEFSIKGATAALNASTPEIQRMREALDWAETYDPQLVAQIRDRAALKQNEKNHDE